MRLVGRARRLVVGIAVAVVVVGLLPVAGVGPTADAAIGGIRAAIRAPFKGGAVTGIQSPSTHHHFYDSGFAWDLHKTPGTAVYARAASSDGTVSYRTGAITTDPNGAGKTVEVQVRVGATTVGTLFFQHLKDLKVVANKSYSSTELLLGYLGSGTFATTNCADGTADGWPWSTSWQVCTSGGVHTHVDVRRGCWRSFPLNKAVAAQAGIILLSTKHATTNNSACDKDELDTVNAGTAQVRSPAQPARVSLGGRFFCASDQVPCWRISWPAVSGATKYFVYVAVAWSSFDRDCGVVTGTTPRRLVASLGSSARSWTYQLGAGTRDASVIDRVTLSVAAANSAGASAIRSVSFDPEWGELDECARPEPSPQSPPTVASPIDPGTYAVVSRSSDKCLGIAGTVGLGSPIRQLQCENTGAQLFDFVRRPDGYYEVRSSTATHLVWDVNEASHESGAAAQLWNGSGSQNQQWAAVSEGDVWFHFVARHSGLCLDIPYGSLDDGLALAQWTCNGGLGQSFALATWQTVEWRVALATATTQARAGDTVSVTVAATPPIAGTGHHLEIRHTQSDRVYFACPENQSHCVYTFTWPRGWVDFDGVLVDAAGNVIARSASMRITFN